MDNDLRAYLLRRDGGCIARYANNLLWAGRYPMLQKIPDPGPCKTSAGDFASATAVWNLTFDEVKVDRPGEPGSHLRMSKKAGFSPETTVVVCWGHHVFGRQWSTSAFVRERIREYIAAANAAIPYR